MNKYEKISYDQLSQELKLKTIEFVEHSTNNLHTLRRDVHEIMKQLAEIRLALRDRR